MKTTSCPYCGQPGLSGSARYPTTLRDRVSMRLHGDVCPRWPNGERSGYEPGQIETPPAGLEQAKPNGASAAVDSLLTREEAASALVELLTRPTLDERRVAEMISEAVAGIELPQSSTLRIAVNEAPEVEIASAHKLLPRLVSYVASGLNVMLVGPAGSGKTTAGSQTAEALGLSYHEQGMGPATSQWDLLGYRSPDGVYVPGSLRQPYEHGGLFFVDEVDNSNPSALVTLNSAIANGHCAFPDGLISKHKDFRLVASANTFGRGADRLYVGRQQLDAATLDRFAIIEWDYDEQAELNWAGGDQPDWVAFVQRCRAKVFDLRMRVVISPRASIMGSTLLRNGRPRDEVESSVLWKGLSRDDISKIRGAW